MDEPKKREKPEGSGKMRSLSGIEKEWLIEDILTGEHIDVSIRKIQDWKGRRDYNKYLKQNPSFRKEIEQAMKDACWFIENDIKNIDKKCRNEKMARVKLDGMLSYLKFFDPSRYGNKLDLSVKEISIRENLDASKKRVLEIMREVGPAALTGTDSKK